MDDTILFRVGQLDDELRAGRLVLPAAGISADNIAALHLLICAVCFAERLRGRFERSVGQKGHDAGKRPLPLCAP